MHVGDAPALIYLIILIKYFNDALLNFFPLILFLLIVIDCRRKHNDTELRIYLTVSFELITMSSTPNFLRSRAIYQSFRANETRNVNTSNGPRLMCLFRPNTKRYCSI